MSLEGKDLAFCQFGISTVIEQAGIGFDEDARQIPFRQI